MSPASRDVAGSAAILPLAVLGALALGGTDEAVTPAGPEVPVAASIVLPAPSLTLTTINGTATVTAVGARRERRR